MFYNLHLEINVKYDFCLLVNPENNAAAIDVSIKKKFPIFFYIFSFPSCPSAKT